MKRKKDIWKIVEEVMDGDQTDLEQEDWEGDEKVLECRYDGITVSSGSISAAGIADHVTISAEDMPIMLTSIPPLDTTYVSPRLYNATCQSIDYLATSICDPFKPIIITIDR